MKYFFKIIILFSVYFVSIKAVNASFWDKLFVTDVWIGYVIKVTDYGIYTGSDRKRKMIFPSSTTYTSKDDCYYYFGKLFSEAPMKSNYPQTNDARSSYLFVCIEGYTIVQNYYFIFFYVYIFYKFYIVSLFYSQCTHYFGLCL